MRSRAYTTSCPGRHHRPSPADIDSSGRAECPVCGRRVKVLVRARFANDGLLARHGFAEGPFVGTVSMTAEQARVMLRMAQLEFAEVNPRWLRAVEGRGRAAYLAAQAGITDAEIAEVYRIPRANVHRMRVRMQAKEQATKGEMMDVRSEV